MNKTLKHTINIILFSAYCVFIVWYTLLCRKPLSHRIFRPELFWAIRTWMIGDPVGRPESVLYILNILFFIPYGFLFPWKKGKRVLIVAATTSTLIELLQYALVLGECEIDDVIANTAGALIGFGLDMLIRKIWNKMRHPERQSLGEELNAGEKQ